MVTTLWATSVAAQSFTDSELLRTAREAWSSNQCVKSARFFFAYQLRNPPALRTDPQHSAAVAKAISWCEQNARVQAGVEYKADGLGGQAQPVQPAPKPPLQLQPVSVAQNAVSRRCDVYATLAVAQSELNQRNHCGFTDTRWAGDYDTHFQWCSAVGAAASRTETDARLQLLQQCAP
jgi:hypothetical protein